MAVVPPLTSVPPLPDGSAPVMYARLDATDEADTTYWTGTAFAADSSPNRALGAIALTAGAVNPDGSYDYTGTLPTGVPAGSYYVSYWQRVPGNASASTADYGPLAREAVTFGRAPLPSVAVTWDGAPVRAERVVSELPAVVTIDVVLGTGQAPFASLGLQGRFGTVTYAAGGTVVVEDDAGTRTVKMTIDPSGLDAGSYLWCLYSQSYRVVVASGEVILTPGLIDQ